MWVSGSGKGTIRKNLEALEKENFEFLKSYVTRDMRPGEIDGDTYWFISKMEFEQAIENWEFLEYEINHKVAYYGTKNSDVQIWLDAWKTLFKEIDTKWLKQLREKNPDFWEHYTSIFLDIPDDVLRERFFDRNPEGSEKDFQNRLESTLFERTQAEEYCDYIIDATRRPEEILDEVLELIKNNS